MRRTVVVTGGAAGIGKAIAEGFSRSGDTVIITGRRVSRLQAAQEELGENVSWARVDATDPQEVQQFTDDLHVVDVLVNNAGANLDLSRSPATDQGLAKIAASWHANFHANVISAVLMTTSCLPKMRSGGSIVTLGSIAAEKGYGSYGAAKAALSSWNVDLAGKIGRLGITANIVAPGYVSDTEFFGDSLHSEVRDTWIMGTLTGQPTMPTDVAAVVVFLGSPNARQITGQVIGVNGGAATS
jgi:3-oxoacyl-[acyl-carrier protein] reductase